MSANVMQDILPFIAERVEIEIPSGLSYVDPVVNYLMDRLTQFGLSESPDSNTCTALHEALTNAIRHGNQLQPDKKVTIVAELTCEQAVITITDEGPGFDPSAQVYDPAQEEHLLSHHGRGLWLIRHFMDEVNHNERGNQITMIKRPRNSP
jgi:serine/threonine-protein kinase RsbW